MSENERPNRNDLIYTYGSWMNDPSSQEATKGVAALVENEQRVTMMDLVGASGYSAGTVAKVLLRLGYLMRDEGKGLVVSTWDKGTSQEWAAVHFRKVNHSRSTAVSEARSRKPEPEEKPEPEFLGWKIIDPDASLPVGEMRRLYSSLGFDVRIVIRVR